jgi:acetylornithine deacetylase
MAVTAESQALQALIGELVAIPSVNPELVPGGEGELTLANHVAQWLRERSLSVTLQETAAPSRPNVIGVAKGRGGGRSLILNAHMDTVGVSGMSDPYSGKVAGGRIFGRGSVDMKAGLAIAMLAASQAARANLRGDVIVAAVADEEYRSIGSEALVKDWRADGAILTEATGLDVITAHKGFGWYEIATEGIAAHGSRPDHGHDAIGDMGGVLLGLKQLALELDSRPKHPVLGAPSVHASLITGGQELSSYPAHCSVQIERRTIPGETRQQVQDEFQTIVASCSAADRNFRGELRTLLWRDCLDLAPDAPIVTSLVRSITKVTGTKPNVLGASGWTDAALLASAGVPAVIFGPTGDGAHGEEEWVDIGSVETCYEAVLATMREFCA